MDNDKVEVVETQTSDTELDLDLSSDETVEVTEEKEAPAEETRKETKPIESQEAKVARLKRIYEREEGKLHKTEPKTEQPKSKSDELDYGQKAFLVASGIKGAEIALAQEMMKRTGLDLEELVSDEYFQSKLSAFREEKATKDAIPKGTKRSAQSPRDSVDYWMAKPFSEVPTDMKRAVLNKKLEKENGNDKFSQNPIIGQ